MSTNLFRPQPLPELSVVVPCYNEAHVVESCLTEWISELRQQAIAFEIIAVNDGSLDGTARVLDRLRKDNRELRVIHQLNTGYHRACLRGYLAARGKYTLQLDGSGRYEPQDFAPLWERRHDSVLVLGTRTHRIDGIFRRLLGAMAGFFVHRIGGAPISDPECHLRLFHTQVAAPVLKSVSAEGLDCNTSLSIALYREFPDQVQQVKTPFRKRADCKIRTPLFSAWMGTLTYALDLWAFRRQLRKGRRAALAPQTA